MKYIKTFENRTVNEDSIKGLESFFISYEKYKDRYNYEETYDRAISRAKYHNIPEELFEEFLLLYFLYDNYLYSRRYSYGGSKEVTNYIKKEVKKLASNSIIKKIEDNIDIYIKITKMFDKRPKWNDSNSFENIDNLPIKYTYFLLKTVINKLPWLNNAQKFNL
jgi:hypothetical protein